MVKGYKRNVVLLKNTGSEIFDMAYFIMKDSVNSDNVDIVREANRILEENTLKKNGNGRKILPLILAFSLGAALTAAAFALVMLI